jgi:hypothetical protein
MFVMQTSYVHLLEAVACQCQLPFHAYLREIADDDTFVGGVEIDVALSDEPAKFRTYFFWGCGRTEGPLQAALKAIRFL